MKLIDRTLLIGSKKTNQKFNLRFVGQHALWHRSTRHSVKQGVDHFLDVGNVAKKPILFSVIWSRFSPFYFDSIFAFAKRLVFHVSLHMTTFIFRNIRMWKFAIDIKINRLLIGPACLPSQPIYFTDCPPPKMVLCTHP